MRIDVKTSKGSYPVYAERGALNRAAEIIGKDRKIFIVTDDGVPKKWVDLLLSQFPDAGIHVFPQGEGSKNFESYEAILKSMLKAGITRKDTLVAIGGGVAGDMGGFAAATYMRGIRFINIPTTTLSQIDSGIGGKTAIDLAGIKNCVGAFWQPSAVIADPQVFETLPKRHVSNGLAEAVKAGIIRDPKLFEIFEKDDYLDHIDEIIEHSQVFKKNIVEEDEFETGNRKLLNFGHSLGHAFETAAGLGEYLHGECVGMGMMAILDNEEIKTRLAAVLKRLNLPLSCSFDADEIMNIVKNDKKAGHGNITVVQADEIGKAYLKTVSMEELRAMLVKNTAK